MRCSGIVLKVRFLSFHLALRDFAAGFERHSAMGKCKTPPATSETSSLCDRRPRKPELALPIGPESTKQSPNRWSYKPWSLAPAVCRACPRVQAPQVHSNGFQAGSHRFGLIGQYELQGPPRNLAPQISLPATLSNARGGCGYVIASKPSIGWFD